jgi:hypothetical protein
VFPTLSGEGVFLPQVDYLSIPLSISIPFHSQPIYRSSQILSIA